MVEDLKREYQRHYFKIWIGWMIITFLFAILVLHDNGLNNHPFTVKLADFHTMISAAHYGLFLIDILLLGLIPFRIFPLLPVFIATFNTPVFLLKSFFAFLDGNAVGGFLGTLLFLDTLAFNLIYLLIASYLNDQLKQHCLYHNENNYLFNWILSIKQTISKFKLSFLVTFISYIILSASIN